MKVTKELLKQKVNMKKNMEKDINNMKCDFCNNEAHTSLGTKKAFNICDECLYKVVEDLAKKKNKCKVCDENYTCNKCLEHMECEDCEELEEVEDDDMF